MNQFRYALQRGVSFPESLFIVLCDKSLQRSITTREREIIPGGEAVAKSISTYLFERRNRSINGASRLKSIKNGLLRNISISLGFRSVVTKSDLQLRVTYSRISGGDLKFITVMLRLLLLSVVALSENGEGEGRGVASKVKKERCFVVCSIARSFLAFRS